MTKEKRVKKTIYVNENLIKRIKIKSAVDGETESNTINSILESYFSKEGQRYIVKGVPK